MKRAERHFSYYLFENFDVEREADNPDNPRRFLGEYTDAALQYVAERPARLCEKDAFRARFGDAMLNRLTRGGVVREENGALWLDTPIFVREDAPVLAQFVRNEVANLASHLIDIRDELEAYTRELSDASPVDVHLYHIVCGAVFDGLLMDSLGEAGVIALGRAHPTGLDYIATIYEQGDELARFSTGGLCSYNRAVYCHCALQSFGDSDGARMDAYRFFRLREAGELTDAFRAAERAAQGMTQAELVREAERFVRSGACSESALRLLEVLGYVRGGKVTVPIYRAEDQAVIQRIGARVEAALLEPIAQAFARMRTRDVLCVRHGVSSAEIANELWHVLFGAINEEVVRRGFAAQPPYRCGEGRYLQSIQLDA